MVATWCPMCARSLSPRQRYCSAACKQKAYRRSLPIGVMSCYGRRGDESAGERVCECPSCVTPTVTTYPPNVTKRNADAVLYSALQAALWKHAKEGRSVTGAMGIVQKVFAAQGYTGLTYEAPLPRLSRSLREDMGTYNAGKLRDTLKRKAFLAAYEQGYNDASREVEGLAKSESQAVPSTPPMPKVHYPY